MSLQIRGDLQNHACQHYLYNFCLQLEKSVHSDNPSIHPDSVENKSNDEEDILELKETLKSILSTMAQKEIRRNKAVRESYFNQRITSKIQEKL